MQKFLILAGIPPIFKTSYKYLGTMESGDIITLSKMFRTVVQS